MRHGVGTDLPPRTTPLFKLDRTPMEGKADTATMIGDLMELYPAQASRGKIVSAGDQNTLSVLDGGMKNIFRDAFLKRP